LRNFKWSSYPVLIGLRKAPDWLETKGNYPWTCSKKEKQKKYAIFVEEGLVKQLDDLKKHVKAQCVLGSYTFTEMLKRKYIDMKEGIKDCPQGKKLSSFNKLADIAKVIADFYEIEEKELFSKCRKGNEPRQALIHYSEIYCRGRYTLTELSEKLNLTIGGYSSCRRSIRKKLLEDKKIKMRFNRLKTKLDNVKC